MVKTKQTNQPSMVANTTEDDQQRTPKLIDLDLSSDGFIIDAPPVDPTKPVLYPKPNAPPNNGFQYTTKVKFIPMENMA